MEFRQFEQFVPKWLLAGGSALLACALLLDLRFLPGWSFNPKKAGEACQTVVQEQTKLSREQLARLLAIAEGDQKQRVREVVKEPYCKLEDLQIRTGATAQREAYPLAFDPQTWLVLLYEGEQYAGYRFSFR